MGRYEVTTALKDRWAYKTPMLRNAFPLRADRVRLYGGPQCQHVIDTDGKLVRILPHGTPTEDMLQEVARLLP